MLSVGCSLLGERRPVVRMRAHPGSRQHRTWRAGCSGCLGTPGPPSAVGPLSGGQARGETQEVAGPVERMRCTQYLQGLGRKGLRDHTGHTAARASWAERPHLLLWAPWGGTQMRSCRCPC